jgi:hypothetical protein
MPPEIKDDTKVDVTDVTKVDDTKASSSIDPGEFEKAKESAEALTSLLKDHGFDSKEDLVKALSSGNELKGKIGDVKVEDILAKAKTLDSYEQYWAAQDTKTKREEETSEETVARLEKRLDAFETGKKKEDLQKSRLEENKKVLDSYGIEVKGVVDKDEGISEEYRPFVGEFLGIDNPANDVDITNKAEVRKMAQDGIKKVQNFEQAVIKRYRDGKIKIPEMTKTEPVDTESIKEQKPQNLAEARKIATEILQKRLAGRT